MSKLRYTAALLTVFTCVLLSVLFLLPEEAWAITCTASCPNGWTCDCSSSFAGCCWKLNGFGCQSYNCSNGALVRTCYC